MLKQIFPRADDPMGTTSHSAEILDQFTKQAETFAERHAHTNEALLELMARCAGVRMQDSVLDVACGPGIVSCFFARRAQHVTGLDVVHAMLKRARRLQNDSHLSNLEWKFGESNHLPFADGAFDCVITRFSFHHFLDPKLALGEMKRVAKPGGTILVADVAPCEETQERFNYWESLRDPSHTRALTLAELEALGNSAGLAEMRKSDFQLGMALDSLLDGSFPRPGDAATIRALFESEIQNGTDTLGVATHKVNGHLRIHYPVVVLSWRKPL